MWPDLILLFAVNLQLFLRIHKGQEPRGVQTLRAELAQKALDEGLVCWFTQAGEVQRDTLRIGP
jgi:hypothetical protein